MTGGAANTRCHAPGFTTLALLQTHDSFLNTARRNQAVGKDRLRLSDAIGAIGGLGLDGWVPPRVVVGGSWPQHTRHRAGLSQLDPRAQSGPGQAERSEIPGDNGVTAWLGYAERARPAHASGRALAELANTVPHREDYAPWTLAMMTIFCGPSWWEMNLAHGLKKKCWSEDLIERSVDARAMLG